jgi:signal peptidase I
MKLRHFFILVVCVHLLTSEIIAYSSVFPALIWVGSCTSCGNDGIKLPPRRPFRTNGFRSTQFPTIVTDDEPRRPFLYHWRRLPKETRKEITNTCLLCSVVVLIRKFIVEPRYVPSRSMYPTFHVGDKILIEKVSPFFVPYGRQEIVIFTSPGVYSDLNGKREEMVKRIIGLAGDRIEFRNGNLFVNGNFTNENYLTEFLPSYNLDTTVVPQGQIFVLGDNRDDSFDSRYWGFLPMNHILGRPLFRFWPWKRFGCVS